jgi:DNA polymerase, archaea type
MAVDLKILDKYIAIAKECGCLLHDVLNSGQQVRIESLLLHEFVKEGRMFPLKKHKEEDDDKESPDQVQGAHVFESERGLHENLIIMDFKSLYPSCIRAYNICWSTIVDGDIGQLNVLTPPNNVHYVSHETYHGIMPRILTTLYNKRLEFKKKLKEAQTQQDKDFYDAAQYSVKILLNSFYGYTGAESGRFFDPRLANSITAIGRETIQLTQKTAESLLPCKIIGGDTDSIFLKLLEVDTPEGGQQAAKLIHSQMLSLLPPPMEIDFEAFAKRALIFQKKRYCMWIFEPDKDGFHDKMKMRGIETRRRDWCPLVGETMTKVLEMILKEGRVEESRVYALDIINNVKRLHDVNSNWELAEKLILSKQLSRGLDQYSVEMPHVEVCRKMEKRGETSYGLGDRVPYMVTPGALKGNVSKFVDTPEYIREHGGAIDTSWYVEKQLLPPISRVFDALNIDIFKGAPIKRQSSLFNF